MTIVGTRPELIRLSRIIPLLDEFCDHILVHTGQSHDWELSGQFFAELGIRAPDRMLECAGATAMETVGNVIARAGAAIAELQPEAVLILGDTNSALAAIPAKRAHVPVFHMEAGNRCFDFRVPEEVNRRIVDHIADINLPYSTLARENLLREGLPPDQIIVTGSPLREVIEHHRAAIEASDALATHGLEAQRFFLVSAHREETVDDPFRLRKLFALLETVGAAYGLPVLFSTHPRTAARIAAADVHPHPLIRFVKPLGFLDYAHLETRAKAVLSDSGTLSEESSILNFPALALREVNERPEGFEEAAVMHIGLEATRLLDALRILDTQPRGGDRLLALVADYAPLNVSQKVLRILLSYTDWVNRRVWRQG